MQNPGFSPKLKKKSQVVVHAFNPITQEVSASLWVQGSHDQQSEFQDSKDYRVKSYLKSPNQINKLLKYIKKK